MSLRRDRIDDIRTIATYRGIMPTPWTDHENELIVADYFRMLAEVLDGGKPNKAQHCRSLLESLNNRTRSAVEYKHQNISAVLVSMAEVWLPGYVPRYNFQSDLVDAVKRWLMQHPDWLEREFDSKPPTDAETLAEIEVRAPPTFSNLPPPEQTDRILRIAGEFDVARRDERNRALGEAGEERVYFHEQFVLKSAGRDDLAKKVRWVSKEDGDGAGYDIGSFTTDGRKRRIEVKTTRASYDRMPFYISQNEICVSRIHRSEWLLFRLWDFPRAPKGFKLYPPLERHVSLMPMSFQASFPSGFEADP